MANNIPGLKTAILAAFTNNLDLATRTKLVARFITVYQNEWTARVASGTVDNATNRANFAMDKLFDYLNGIYFSGSQVENAITYPPEKIT